MEEEGSKQLVATGQGWIGVGRSCERKDGDGWICSERTRPEMGELDAIWNGRWTWCDLVHGGGQHAAAMEGSTALGSCWLLSHAMGRLPTLRFGRSEADGAGDSESRMEHVVLCRIFCSWRSKAGPSPIWKWMRLGDTICSEVELWFGAAVIAIEKRADASWSEARKKGWNATAMGIDGTWSGSVVEKMAGGAIRLVERADRVWRWKWWQAVEVGRQRGRERREERDGVF